jgi:adrenodoxin-NADP+ reductase
VRALSTAPALSFHRWNSLARSNSKRQPFTSDAKQDKVKLLSVAIVGSGPSGCYTAKYLQSAFEKAKQTTTTAIGPSSIKIDVLDRLPTPYGLVRFGVAPDHPEVKNVQNDFDVLFNEKGVSFYGNVDVGHDVSVQELREMYNVVVLSYGCQSDRSIGLPGAELDGVMSAREFVAWYNGT